MEFNIVELAEKLARNRIDSKDAKVQKAQSLIKEMMKTEEGRNELAEIVSIALEDTYNEFDITPMLFETRHFNYGDKPTFKTHKKGIVAYWAAPNSYIPKSRNYETEITMEFESLGVRPEALLSDLKTGRIDSLAALIKDGRDAIEIELYRKVYEVLAQAYNATKNAENFAETNALSKEVMDAAINHIRKKVAGTPVIVADFDLCTQLEGFEGYKDNESVQDELRNRGFLGKYRGCPIVYLPEILDPVTQQSIVPKDKMFIVGNKVGVAATYGDVDFMQETNIDDKSWNCRVDKEVGYCVTKPEGLFVINITA